MTDLEQLIDLVRDALDVDHGDDSRDQAMYVLEALTRGPDAPLVLAESLSETHAQLSEMTEAYNVLADELGPIREALVKWDFWGDGNRSRAESAMQQRDEIVDYLTEKFDPARPYVAVDHVIELLHERWEKVDAVLYDVIPEDHWGLTARDIKWIADTADPLGRRIVDELNAEKAIEPWAAYDYFRAPIGTDPHRRPE